MLQDYMGHRPRQAQGLLSSAPITHQELPHFQPLPSLLSWAEVDLESLLRVQAAERWAGKLREGEPGAE